ncbi:hypothetical protein KVR01_003474 [Diaporthe batatas]|uniref:uncharacterized protein n=1 Tax=Diaporthe batatas TaxID=748121 RepID=UPI001D036801|nr:uncharacterized protein KVR01_003474 [Diaporthe batatas]KAG8167785.1 hypothetical protein KVR01_003474 [Diaporthe batatas]
MKVALFFVALCASLASAAVTPSRRCASEYCTFVMTSLVTRDVQSRQTKLMPMRETGLLNSSRPDMDPKVGADENARGCGLSHNK